MSLIEFINELCASRINKLCTNCNLYTKRRLHDLYVLVDLAFVPMVINVGSKGLRSGESARLPPIWPGFKYRRRCHIWVEFVVGSLLCSERFFSGYSGFLLSSKTNISKFQLDPESGRRRTTLWMCYLQIIIIIIIIIMVFILGTKTHARYSHVVECKVHLELQRHLYGLIAQKIV